MRRKSHEVVGLVKKPVELVKQCSNYQNAATFVWALQETIWKPECTEVNEILKQNNYLITDPFGSKWIQSKKEYSCKNVKLTSMETAV